MLKDIKELGLELLDLAGDLVRGIAHFAIKGALWAVAAAVFLKVLSWLGWEILCR